MNTTKTTILSSLLSCIFGCQAQNPNSYTSLSVDEYEKAITDPSVIRLDVRTANEYANGHIEGAINIDVLKDDFTNIATSTLPKDKTIAVNCRSGKRSKKAAQILANNGNNVIELDAGYTAWTNAGKPVTKEEVDLFTTQDGTTIYIYCIKHGSIKMNINEQWIYIDPVADNIPPATDYSTMPRADVILITHEHGDHFDPKAINQLRKEDTQIICNHRVSELLNEQSTPLANGETKNIGTLTINAVPAYNNSADKLQFHPKGRDNGYILNINNIRIYIAGDTEDISEMSDINNIDIAFIPCNLPYTMTPQQFANAARIVNPRVLFPYHYGTTDIQQVIPLLDGTNIDTRIRQYQ